MSTKNIKSLKELADRVKSGKIDESRLCVYIDNDDTYFTYREDKDKHSSVIEANIGEGYNDIYELYEILFPKSAVRRV